MKHMRMLLTALLSIVLILTLIIPASAAGTPSIAIPLRDNCLAAYDSGPASITPQIGPAVTVGQTREVNCDILTSAHIAAYLDGVEKDSTFSDGDGNYMFELLEPGQYEVVASKWGFRDQRQSIDVALEQQHTLDFTGDHGLVPNSPELSYVLACINLWQFGEPPCKLTMSTVLAVINAWQFPVADKIVYYEHTKDITEEEVDNVAELTEERDKILFQELTDFVAGIQVGDVLVSEHSVPGAEYGFLKRVVGITNGLGTLSGGGAVEVEVEPATLEDVIQQGVVSVNETIPLEDLLNDAVWAEGVEVQQIQAGRRFSYTPADGVKFEGYLRVTADAQVDIETRYRIRLEEFKFVFSPGLELEVTLTVEQDVQWNEKYTLATITGPAIPIYGPVTITPTIELVVGTDGTIAAHLETTATYDRVYDVGIRYLRHDGWSTISNMHGEGFTLDGPHFTGSAEARVFAGAVLSGRTGVSRFAEATLGTELLCSIRATGVIETSLWYWQYDIDLYMNAQVFANLELARIAGVGWESDVWEYPDPPYNLAYGASGRVRTEGGDGLEGVTINFSGDHSSTTTNADGYWAKHLLSGQVEVTPEKDGYVFHPASVDTSGSASDLDFEAFEEGTAQYELSTSSTAGGSVSTPGEGSFAYYAGTVVDLVAEAEGGYRFVTWTGDVDTIADVDAASTTIAMQGNYSVTASFEDTTGPFEIRDWYDLDAMRHDLSGTYVLMNHLDSTTAGYNELASLTANEGKGWQPIGDSGARFTGTFDGHGYEISDLIIDRPAEYRVGLFGSLGKDGVIENLGLVSVAVTGGSRVGGLVGENHWSWGGTVRNCYSGGSVTGEGWYVGGLVGYNHDGTVVSSFSSSDVTGHSSRVGGLVGGNAYGTVTDSYATGSVLGQSNVGGLVGRNANPSGGVKNSYSLGSVTGHSSVGGLVGYNDFAPVSRSFWDTETSGQSNSAGGTGKTTAEMQSIATFSGAGWSIIAVANSGVRNTSYVWNIVDGQTYPFLSWQSVS